MTAPPGSVCPSTSHRNVGRQRHAASLDSPRPTASLQAVLLGRAHRSSRTPSGSLCRSLALRNCAHTTTVSWPGKFLHTCQRGLLHDSCHDKMGQMPWHSWLEKVGISAPPVGFGQCDGVPWSPPQGQKYDFEVAAPNIHIFGERIYTRWKCTAYSGT